ncbi:response regulator [Altererythrobacter soli]|uniref:Response regulator n=1 Tax=Croceibacterium soli TaxID=1739690 RepID=A0A6I4UVF6_9SPHN|nr:response regulator [Croceibacterium soli]MXP41493.1 response regulator [Croceibacterium soli]
MSKPNRRVYIVDDDSSVRRSMRFVLAAAGYEPRPFASGEDFLEELPHLQPGCVLLDVRMPQLNGLQVLSTVRERGNRFPVLVITGHGDVPTAVEAMKLGADDFLEKPFVDDVLLRSLETLSARLNEDAEHDRRLAEASERIALLTQREREVLQGLIGGYSNKEIALKLSLSVRTVESYRADLMRKLEMSSVADLVRFGILLNLPPLD